MAHSERDLARILKENPELSVVNDSGAQPKTEARRELEKAIKESLTRLFLAHWERNELPKLTPEYRFHPTRKWRFDYALPDLMIAIEIDGGTRQQGRHNRADGYAKDAEKINTAQGMGWIVFRFSDVMLKEGRDAMDVYLQPVKDAIGEAK
jgi:very-short-patch-repair endonuclease